MPTYQPNIPTGSIPLNQDYLNLQGNFQQLNIAYGFDHVPLTDTSGIPPGGITGIHKIIHLQSNATPAAVPQVGQFFNAFIPDGYDTDTVLFLQTGGGKLLQLTSNVQPSLSTSGYTFLPGGLIFQWGTVNAPGSSGNVVFTSVGCIAFAHSIFNVQLTVRRDSSSSTQGMYVNGAPSLTGFSYNGSSAPNALFWTAIGY